MRKLFSSQLIEARHEMLSIFESLDLTLHDAIKAFVTDDKKLAGKAKKRTLQADARCANLEAVCYNLIATQSPVASDFRLLQTIIYMNFNLERISDHVRSIARGAKRKAKAEVALPAELVELVEKEAKLVYRVMGTTATALVDNDLVLMRSLTDQDEPVRAVYEEFFRVYNHLLTAEEPDEGAFDDLRRTIMTSRYLERISFISVELASRLTFLLTGQRWSTADVVEADVEELESMRIPSGEGVILEPTADARYVAGIPAEEMGESLRELIENASDEDSDESDED
ncbi:phosphate uptake regulator, PhoU [Coriobacterium glomerans PW2]|uniref:Phosphate uptake regulator, PhoU n=1 Tax=Coriobacterium glomerans (strain ATCC 49209 / DSM 20642 / JCM 10262 / PW2) TaxID=700015 RepID=F2NBS7_CORGP|nr:PhoU domain-containing protein [Coriobacterium glomerans]AEB06886.1 phosphate uptake regulator, PhoU [Coriobacterium glomerans PW2]